MRHESAFVGRFEVDAAYVRYLRMKKSGDLGQDGVSLELTVAGDEPHLGELENRTYADHDPGTLYDGRADGTHCYVANGAIAIGDDVSSAAAGKVQSGSGGAVFLGTAMSATTADGEEVEVFTIDKATTLARSAIVQDDLQVYELDLEDWGPTDAPGALGASAGTPSGAFGMTVGTHGAAAKKIVGEAASAGSKTNTMRRTVTLPPEYVAGETAKIRVIAEEGVGAATVSTTVDVQAYSNDDDGTVTGDLCTTDAVDVTDTVGNKDFTLNPATLTPGMNLDVEITGVANDTGGSVGTVLTIYRTQLLLDVKG